LEILKTDLLYPNKPIAWKFGLVVVGYDLEGITQSIEYH
jgi:hypothetical protein